jgi:hypothetical protein
MPTGHSDLSERIALALAAYVFTTLLWVFGQPLWVGLLLVVGPIAFYVLVLALLSRSSVATQSRGQFVARTLLGGYLACLLAFSLHRYWA